MEKFLKFYTYVDGVNDTAFPSDKHQLEAHSFQFDAKRMGNAPGISCSVYYPKCLDSIWTYNVYVVFNKEKYFIKQIPTSQKDNTNQQYKHEIELVSERYILDCVYFYDVVSSDSDDDKPVSNGTNFTFYGDIDEFASRLNQSLQYRGIDYTVVVDDGVSSEAGMFSFEDKFFSEAIQESFNVLGVPYYFDGHVIHFGYTNNAITHTFKYGRDESLLSIQKQNAGYKVVTRCTGIGSEDNIPYYYPNDFESKAEVEANGGVWINPTTNLMPPIYRETNGKERFYDAKNDTYLLPDGSGEYYKFENEFVEGHPKEQLVEFEDIKPTIKGVMNSYGQRIDVFSDFAYDTNDNDETDEEGNYIHPYFFGKLRKMDGEYGFNLFEHSIDEGEMTISMTSGTCGACEWVIMVDENTQMNTVQVDSDGNLYRDEEGNILFGEAQERQNDTSKYEVWVALKKDINTFGVIMPNATHNYRPSAGDTFVILHILLPKAYILAAENKLKEQIIQYMSMNNSEKFNFSISFSRIFFAEHPEILELLNENARIQLEYDDQWHELYVSSFSYRMDGSSPLPEIRVELTDTLTISQNALQLAISEVQNELMKGSGSVDFLKTGLAYFLRKDMNDRTKGKLSTDVGFEVGKFVTGASGGIFYIDKNTGHTVAEMDKLYVRMKAYFETLEIVNVNSVGGKIIVSPAGSIKCIKVEKNEEGDYFRCYMLAEQDGEKIENRFHVGDQAYSQMFNAKEGVSNKISNQYYWRLVVGVGDDYIDLSISDCDVDSDEPKVGDVICHRGNRNDVDRQNFIEISSVDAFSPNMTLFQGVDSYSLVDKNVVDFGVDKTTGKSYMNVYGDMYVGDRNNESYLRYSQEDGLTLRGKLDIGTKFGDKNLQDILDSIGDGYKEDGAILDAAIQANIENELGLYNHDGLIEWHFVDTKIPVYSTSNEQISHAQDLCFTLDQSIYQYVVTSEGGGWEKLESPNDNIIAALTSADKSKDTTDGLRRIYINDPVNDEDVYDIGDVWYHANYSDDDVSYDNVTLRAIVSKASGQSFSISHWVKADDFSDYAIIQNVIEQSTNTNQNLNSVQNEVKNMKDFTDEAFADGIVTRAEAEAIASYLNNIDTLFLGFVSRYEELVNNSLLLKDDGTESVELQNLKLTYNDLSSAKDALVSSINNAIEDGVITSVERANVDAKYTTFNTKYQDALSYIQKCIQYVETRLNTDIQGYAYLKASLKENTKITGGLVQTSSLVLGYTNEDGEYVVMSGTNGLVTDKGIRTPAFWMGGDMIDIFDYYDSENNKFNVPDGVRPATGMDRMDGTGYRANGALWWDNSGNVHADPLSFFVGEATVGLLLASFQIVPKADGKSPDYIIPQVPFQSLTVASDFTLGTYQFVVDSSKHNITIDDTESTNSINLIVSGDVVAYADYSEVEGLPIASKTSLGLVKIGDNLTITEDGVLSAVATGSGGVDFTVGTGLNMSSTDVLSVVYGTTAGTACQGNDSRLSDSRKNPNALTLRYLNTAGSYVNTTYDGSSAVAYTIPYKISDLYNDSDFLTSVSWSDINNRPTALSSFTNDLVLTLAQLNAARQLSGEQRIGYSGNTDFTYFQQDVIFFSNVKLYLTTNNTNTGYVAQNGRDATFAYLAATSGLNVVSGTTSYPTRGITFGGTSNTVLRYNGTDAIILSCPASSDAPGKIYIRVGGTTTTDYETYFNTDGSLISKGDIVAYGSTSTASLPIATTTTAGIIKVGSNLTITSDGVLSAVVSSGDGGLSGTVGSGVNPIYLSSGTLTASTSTVGSATKPIYLSSGTLTASATSVGNTTKPVYLSSGTITAFSSSVGSSTKPIYMLSGALTACSTTVGSTSLPVYMSSGTVTSCTASSLFSDLSYSSSTLSVTVAGKTRTCNISASSSSGGGWAGGNYNDSTLCTVTNDGNGGLKFCRTSDYTAIKVGGGNGIIGYSGSGYSTIGNLYFNWQSSTKNVQINADCKITYVSLGQWSDMRLKDRIKSVDSALDKIKSLDIFYYKWKEGDKNTHIGVSAQEVQCILPELVDECNTNDRDCNSTNYLTVDYQCLNVVGLQAIKELYHKHLALEGLVRSNRTWEKSISDRINHLTKENVELRRRIGQLEVNLQTLKDQTNGTTED